MRAALLLIPLLAACAPDLPDTWEEAVLVEQLTQSECGGDPYEGYQTSYQVQTGMGQVELSWYNAHFRCEQELEAWYVSDGPVVRFLVRPVDMSPKEVASCDCLYDIDMRITGQDEDIDEVTLWRQWDDLNDANEPVEVVTLYPSR